MWFQAGNKDATKSFATSYFFLHFWRAVNKISCIFTYFFAISQNLCKEDFEFLRKIAVYAILETVIMGRELKKKNVF